MSFVTTNIRIPEEDYLKLKEEAAKKRKSFAAIVREKLGANTKPTNNLAEKLLEIGRKAEKEHWGGPKDLSVNHNRYFIEAYNQTKGKK